MKITPLFPGPLRNGRAQKNKEKKDHTPTPEQKQQPQQKHKSVARKFSNFLHRNDTKGACQQQDEDEVRHNGHNHTPEANHVSLAKTVGEEESASSYYEDTSEGYIRFDPFIQYHDDPHRDLSDEQEVESCWYNSQELKEFSVEQMQTTQNIFEDHFRLEPQQAATAQEWRAIFVRAYEACCRRCEQEQESEPAGSSKTTGSRNARATHSHEEEFEQAMRALEQLYQRAYRTAHTTIMQLAGLETNFLARIRGKAIRQRRSILQHIEEHCNNDGQDQEGNDTLKGTFEYAEGIISITSPSMEFAHLVAVAHAKALTSD